MMVFSNLLGKIQSMGACFLVLIDPDKQSPDAACRIAEQVERAGADAILVGGSYLYTDGLHQTVEAVKAVSTLPVVLFPGVSSPATQISSVADGILLLSLVSGRNPEYLIGEHVRSALWIDRSKLEVIPTAYILVESGIITSAEFFSATRPIPAEKAEIAMVHALAGQQLGMKLVYLDAGSGARRGVPDEMIRSVKSKVSCPIVVGGGIRDADTAHRKVMAGAQMVVVGTAIEHCLDPGWLRELVQAVHVLDASVTG